MTEPDDNPKVLIGYARQSRGKPGETRETSLSLESQEDEIRAWGQANGFRVERAIRDHDLVGDDAHRPGIAEMEAPTAPGVTFAVFKWDRLARDLILQETIVRGRAPGRVDRLHPRALQQAHPRDLRRRE